MFLIKNYEWKTDSYGFQYRTDANGTLIVPRALEIRESQVFERKTAPLGVEELVPTQVDLPFGPKSMIFEYIDNVGEAEFQSGSNKNVPFADVNLVEEEDKIYGIRSGYQYNQEEWDALNEAAKMQAFGRNANISTVRQSAAVKALMTKDHLVGMFGSAERNMTGFYNNAQVPVNAATINPFAATTDASTLLDFYIEELIGTIEDASELVEQPTVIVQSKRLTRKLMTTQIENGANEPQGVTAMDIITRNLQQAGTPVTIVSRNESRADILEQYGVRTPGTNEDRIVVYNRDPESLSRNISRIRVGDWESYHGEYSRIMDMKIKAVRWHYPNSAQYVDHAIAP